MLFVVLSVFLYTYLSVKYLKLALYNSSNWVQYLWPLFIFSADFRYGKVSLFFSFQLSNLLTKISSEGFSGSDIYDNKNTLRQV